MEACGERLRPNAHWCLESPLSSLVPGRKRDFLVTALPIPIRRLREPTTGAAFPPPPLFLPAPWKEVTPWPSGSRRASVPGTVRFP